MLERELIEVGYFLSRLGIDGPPKELQVATWKEAYQKFYPTFGLGKTEEEFQNSLKNLRDHFDSHNNNDRNGWLDGDEAQTLSSNNQVVFDELKKLTEQEVWERVRNLAVTSYDTKIAKNEINKVQEEQAKYFSSEFKGTKKIPKKKQKELYVSHGIVVDELKKFIESKSKEGTIYNTQKIDLAVDDNNSLKEIYEVKTSNDTQSIYTAVGQLFMHSAGSISTKKWIVLPSPVDNIKLLYCLSELGINLLCYDLENNQCEFYTVSP